MENLLSILVIVVITIVILRLLVFKRRKGLIKRRIGQLKIISILLITGIFWCPLTILYCVRNPEKALIYGAKMGLVALRVKGDVSSTIRRFDNKLNNTLEPYAPKVGKQIVKTGKKSYTRYGVRDTQRFVAGTASQTGIVMYKPKPSLFERVGNGISNVIKVICSPIRNILGFFKV